MDSTAPRPRRFRFGVLVGGLSSGGNWATVARGAENIGYSTLVMPDHLNEQLSPIPALAAAATATTTLRVGTLALANDLRHPLLVARDAATVDVISGGRFELGLGAGWLRDDFDQAGVPFDGPATRVRRLAEAVDVIRGAWQEPGFTFRGRYYTVAVRSPGLAPIQRPVPVLIGGGGREVLSLAARQADIVGINPNLRTGTPAPSDIDEQLGWVRTAAGSRYPDLEINVLLQVVEVRPSADRPDRASPYVAAGEVPELVDLLEQRRARWDISYVCVPAAAMLSFAPVVERLTGR